MTKVSFLRHAIISIAVTVLLIAFAIVFFSVFTYYKYPMPNEENTTVKSGTVKEVYYMVGRDTVGVELSDGNVLIFVYPFFAWEFYSHIGYNLDELCDLLEGKSIEYRQMNTTDWVLEIYVDDAVIDNVKLTEEQLIATWVGAVIISILMLALIICFEYLYLHPKYKSYRQYERKRLKKVMRELQKAQRREKKQNAQ